MRHWTTAVAVAALALAILVPPLGLPDYYVSLLTQTWIFGIAAMSLDILVGFTGLVSFSHAAFFGMGAYVAAVLATRTPITGFGAILVLGVLAATLLAALFGFLVLRGEGVSFTIISLALNEIVWGLAYQWVAMSGGDNGITGFPRPRIGPFDTSGNAGFYYLSLAVLLVCVVLLLALVRSPFGLALVGVRERPRRMRALGYNVWFFRYAAFVVAGAFAGLAGVLFAYYNQFVGPVALSLQTTTQMLIMVILGGRGTLLGSLVGAGVVVFVSNALSNLTQRWQLILGALYVVILMYAPDGLLGAARRIGQAVARRFPRLAAAPGGGQDGAGAASGAAPAEAPRGGVRAQGGNGAAGSAERSVSH
jgi:branched-chain amino acid transport system permease protein